MQGAMVSSFQHLGLECTIRAGSTSELRWWWTSEQQSKVCGKKKAVFTRLIWMGCGKGQPRVTTQNSGAPWKNNNMYDQEKTPYNPNDLQVSHLYNVSICDTEVKTVDSETCGFTYISFVSILLELRQRG